MFEDVVIEKGDFRVVWEHIGEGVYGDYDPEDEQDEPLLRFSCYKRVDGEWDSLEDASYCTRMPLDSPREHLERGAESIFAALESTSYKRALEALSWFEPSDFSQPS